MTVLKTEADLKEPGAPRPKLINTEATDESVKALKARYPHAREIEKLPSGTYAVRFMKKRTKYLKGRK